MMLQLASRDMKARETTTGLLGRWARMTVRKKFVFSTSRNFDQSLLQSCA